MGTKYTLKVKNQSSNPGYICVYQTQPNSATPNIMSLAWFSEYAFPSTVVQFDWEEKYGFVWDETGELVPGVTFDASQNWDADPSTLNGNNQVTLNYDKAYTFKNAQKNPTAAGSLVIVGDSTVPVKQASMGISMSGKGAFVVQAQPNWTSVFTPKPTYWLTFGDYQQGAVLDITQLTSNSQKLDYTGVYTLQYSLDGNNLWVPGIH